MRRIPVARRRKVRGRKRRLLQQRPVPARKALTGRERAEEIPVKRPSLQRGKAVKARARSLRPEGQLEVELRLARWANCKTMRVRVLVAISSNNKAEVAAEPTEALDEVQVAAGARRGAKFLSGSATQHSFDGQGLPKSGNVS